MHTRVDSLQVHNILNPVRHNHKYATGKMKFKLVSFVTLKYTRGLEFPWHSDILMKPGMKYQIRSPSHNLVILHLALARGMSLRGAH